jgi:lipopolysaccharide export system permease protein
MNIQDRYIAKTLFSFTAMVLIIWLGVYSFFNFLEEMNSIRGSAYTSLDAIIYIVLKMPDVIYSQSSSIILLGCVLGMGHLATSNQLIVMQISGVSILQMTIFTIKIALIFIFILIFVGEIIAPLSSEQAEKGRAKALGISNIAKNQDGFWIKDGKNFINVKKNLDGKLFFDISIFEINQSNSIKTVTTAESAKFEDQVLKMVNTEIFSIDDSIYIDNIATKKSNSLIRTVEFDSSLIDSLRKSASDLTTWTIIRQIQYLSANKLKSDGFEIELYKRLVRPFTLVAMILLAMIFIFGSNRTTTLGKKIFFGISLALIFEMISRIGTAISLGFELNPIIITTLPTFIVMFISAVILIRKSVV